MKNILYILLFFPLFVFGQLPGGSTAPDFTITDIDGNTYNLYDILDEGKPVLLELFAVWSGPDWTFNETGVLNEFNSLYGPNGDNSVFTIAIESDASTPASDLSGGSSSVGDWTSLIGHPLADDANASIATDYLLAYYPTIYLICPDRSVTEIGQGAGSSYWTVETLAEEVFINTCPQPIEGSNVVMQSYNSELISCGGDIITPVVTILNMGTVDITDCIINTTVDGTTVSSTDWTGSLTTFGSEQVTLADITPGNQSVTYEVVMSNDLVSGDNSIDVTLNTAITADAFVHVQVNTDFYAGETTWEIADASGSVVMSGAYESGTDDNWGGGGTDADMTHDHYASLENGCYTFTAMDSYGDGQTGYSGMGAGTDGAIVVTDGEGVELLSITGSWGAVQSVIFEIVSQSENDTGCTDILDCNYQLDEPCVYPGENEFNNYIENYFDVSQIDVQGASVFIQGTDLFSQGTSVYLQGSNIFTQGTSLLFYGVSAFLEMIVDEIYSVFDDYESETVFDCEGCINDIDANNICDEFQIGCPFPEFLEYNPIALTFDYSLCQTYVVYGCIDVWALNFNADANVDDGTCEYINCDIVSEWEVANTGSNMTLMIPSDIEVTINGAQVSSGSALGVFYEDSYGDLQCAGYTLLTGETSHISAMADDETTEEIDGLTSGEQMIWQIFDEMTCVVYSGSVLYSMGSNVFTPNDLAFVESVTYSCQLLEFPAGWFMFSTYIEPGNIDLVSVLDDLGDKVIIVKNNNGDAYLPEWSYNGIGDVVNGQGYSIKLSESSILEICGTYFHPEINPIELTSGWNTIAYLRLEPANVEMVFESVVSTSNLVIVKDYNGNPYLPQWNYNGIGDLYPGQAYQLKVIQPDVIVYLSNSLEYRPFTLDVFENNLKHFQRIKSTGNNMHIVFPRAAWTKHAYTVIEIAAYNTHGGIIGSTVCSSENTVLTLWGNDETTNSIDGLLSDESITFKLWNGTERLDFEVENWNKGYNRYSVNAINIVGTVKIGEEGNQLFEALPNPSNRVTTISFFIAEKGNVKISVYNVLGELVKGVINSERTKGYHAININVSSLKPGSYYYSMETNNFKKSKQLVIIK